MSKKFMLAVAGMLVIAMSGIAGLQASKSISDDSPQKPLLVQANVAQENKSPVSQSEFKLSAPLSNKIRQLSQEGQTNLLGDPLFLEYMRAYQNRSDLQMQVFDKWMQGAKDNFCRDMLGEIAAKVYDSEGLKKLNLSEAQAACPQGVKLDETVSYLNKKLAEAFDDPYTSVLPPARAQAVADQLHNKEHIDGGVGMLFTVDRSHTLPGTSLTPDGQKQERYAFTGLIYHVSSQGPAAAMGIKDGDQLLKIDDVDVVGLEFEHVLKDLIIGKPGSSVKLRLKRDAIEYERTVKRGVVQPDQVWIRDLGERFYAIVVTRWSEDVSGQIFTCLQQLKQVGARGIAIDLRNNPGGLWDQAVITASYAVKDGKLVSTRERVPSNPGQPVSYRSTSWERRNGALYVVKTDEASGATSEQRQQVTLTQVNLRTLEKKTIAGDVPFIEGLPPLVIMVNGFTASASEVTSGALMQNRVVDPEHNHFEGATVIGSATYGKGIAQDNASAPMHMRQSVTVGRYFLKDGSWPGDAHNHRNPIKPDIVVDEPEGAQYYTASDLQLKASLDFLKGLAARLPQSALKE